MQKASAPQNLEEKIDRILEHLARMDRRDKWRMIGGCIRGVIGIIPVIMLLTSMWYIYAHGADLLQLISQEAAKQAMQATKQGAGGMNDMMKQLQQLLTK